MAGANSDERELISLCSKDAQVDSIEEVKLLLSTKSSNINIDSTDKDGMTPLMHAAFAGKLELCQLLLDNGADVNSSLHSEGYTPLMFATIAGHTQIVRLFLNHGAKTDTVNRVNRTAAQMGGFVGQVECVQLINGFFSLNELKYYTQIQGLESTPKLDPSLLLPLYEYITTTNIHPVNLLLLLQSKDLIQYQSQIGKVLDIICDKAFKEVNEPFSLKIHLLVYLLKLACTGDSNTLMKSFLTQSDDGKSLEVERFLRECLKSYPHVHSILLKQIISSVAKVPLGEHPTTISLLNSAVFGNRNFVDQETCSTCGMSSDKLKKCSKCKRVYYCNVDCQKLAWTVGNHKKLCKKWAKDITESSASNKS